MFLENYGCVWELFLRAFFVFQDSFLFYIFIFLKEKDRNMSGCRSCLKQGFEIEIPRRPQCLTSCFLRAEKIPIKAYKNAGTQAKHY